MDPPVYLKAGDLVELGIDQLGSSSQLWHLVNLGVQDKVAVVTWWSQRNWCSNCKIIL